MAAVSLPSPMWELPDAGGCWALSAGCSHQGGLLTAFSKKHLPASRAGRAVSFPDTFQSNEGSLIFPFYEVFYCVCFAPPCAVPGPAGGSVGVRMAPAGPRAGNEPPKIWLFASETFIKRALRRGSAGSPALPKEGSKTQVLLCKCTLRNGAGKALGGERGKGKEEK